MVIRRRVGMYVAAFGVAPRASGVSFAGVEGNGSSIGRAISADGRDVAFTSGASNLAAGDTIGFADVFVRDRASATTRRVA